jgi:hypothetical protein
MSKGNLTLGRHSSWIRFTALLTIIALIVGCSSSTVIRSRPLGATVYIDNIRIGKTPVEYSDTAIAGTVKNIRLTKDGYMPLETVLRKDEFQVGPCIGGVLILFPFVWILGYHNYYEFELEPDFSKMPLLPTEKPATYPQIAPAEKVPLEVPSPQQKTE